ncbi:MAG: C40 family peptidase [Firmicutes bacterium]|nr:C40 family peptidase [Bacillota bacterium]
MTTKNINKSNVSRYIGITYKLNGRDFSGTDCLGLVWLYLRDQGISIPDGDELPIDENWQDSAESRFIKGLDAIAQRVEAPQKNDIVLIHCFRQSAHIGVMLDSQTILHSPDESGSQRNLLSNYGKHRVLGFWRLR